MAAIWLIWSSLWLLFFIDGCTRGRQSGTGRGC
ncbi:hypothetical protein RLIN73S_02069 [Rhodanobacter lindaniclasticus]